MLFDPDRHLPVHLAPATDAELVDGIQTIVTRVLEERQDQTWRTHPSDHFEGFPPSGLTALYLGAGGVLWALAGLARDGVARPVDVADDLHAFARGFRAVGDPDAPGWFMGRAGVVAMALSERWEPALANTLAEAIASNRANPCWEPFWGSPGTMLAARMASHSAPDVDRWRSLWLDSSRRLLEQREPGGLWTQDLYGQVYQSIGAGHGYVGNLQALFNGGDWLEPALAEELSAQAVVNLERLAHREDGAVNWPSKVEGPTKGQMQWCHGAPGVITSLRSAPSSAALHTLLVEAGEGVWRAGPLAKGTGLCHGTAGNGYAFMALYERTGDDLWLERARTFAAHALDQVVTSWTTHGMARASLFTGDIGVACFLSAILRSDARWPLLDV